MPKSNDKSDREMIASRLREARKNAGLSQAQAAKLLDLHRPTVSEIEAGRRRVTAEEIRTFSKLYEISESWLLGGSGTTGEQDPRVDLAARELSKLSKDDFERVVRLLHAVRAGDDVPE